MSEYSITQPIHSCFIDKSIINQIEDYLLTKAASLNNKERDAVKSNFKIEINDSFGKETFNSIKEYSRDKFTNDIKRIVVSYNCWEGPLKTLSISFSIESLWSEIKVEMEENNAREIVIGMTHEIKNIIKETTNLNYLFYGFYTAVISSIFSGCLFYSTLILLVEGRAHADISIVLNRFFIVSAILVICSVWLILKLLNPYIVFDTKRNRSIKQASNFIVQGILGCLIFERLFKYFFKLY